MIFERKGHFEIDHLGLNQNGGVSGWSSLIAGSVGATIFINGEPFTLGQARAFGRWLVRESNRIEVEREQAEQ